MKLRYHLSPGLLPGVSQLNVSLNGTLSRPSPPTPATHPARSKPLWICPLNYWPPRTRSPSSSSATMRRNAKTPPTPPCGPVSIRTPPSNSRARVSPGQRPWPAPTSILRPRRQSPSRRAHRLSLPAVGEGNAGSGNRRVVVRHPRQWSHCAVFRLHRRNPSRQRSRDSRAPVQIPASLNLSAIYGPTVAISPNPSDPTAAVLHGRLHPPAALRSDGTNHRPS